MTTLAGRPQTALLVVDVQIDVMAVSIDADIVVENIGKLVAQARDAATPIVWIQHSDDGLVFGTNGWNYVPELQRLESEPLIHKLYGDAFEDTDLEATLSELGIGALVVVGAQTDACIRSTVHGAFARGYDVALVSDAHTTEDLTAWGAPPPREIIAHTNLYWSHQRAPGRTAATPSTAEVHFEGRTIPSAL